MDEEGVAVMVMSVDTKERSGDALLVFWGGVWFSLRRAQAQAQAHPKIERCGDGDTDFCSIAVGK
jgi:hypothetical protein